MDSQADQDRNFVWGYITLASFAGIECAKRRGDSIIRIRAEYDNLAILKHILEQLAEPQERTSNN